MIAQPDLLNDHKKSAVRPLLISCKPFQPDAGRHFRVKPHAGYLLHSQ